MRFALAGKEYEFDSTLTVEEAMFLYDKTQLGVNEFDAALTRGNPYAIAAWISMLMTRHGVAARWQDVQKLDIRTWNVIADPVAVDEDAPEEAADMKEAPDPTRAGPTPTLDTSGIS